eukprot:scpid112353/ scgid23568/ 
MNPGEYGSAPHLVIVKHTTVISLHTADLIHPQDMTRYEKEGGGGQRAQASPIFYGQTGEMAHQTLEEPMVCSRGQQNEDSTRGQHTRGQHTSTTAQAAYHPASSRCA